MRARHVITGVLTLAALAGAGVVLSQFADAELPNPFGQKTCKVSGADGGSIDVDSTQASNAATIAAVGDNMDLPDRAVVVALATAWQESELENIEHGDRDSIGLFQQRPSQGWGSVEEIKDPRYAATRFYQALSKVDGWEDMRVTDAAQAVQRSAYPEAYQQWADEAQILAEAMLGDVDAAVACRVGEATLADDAAVDAVTSEFGLDWDWLEPETDGNVITLSDVDDGWQYAHWMVAYSKDLGVSTVAYDGKKWSAESGEWEKEKDTDGNTVTVHVHSSG